MQVQRTKDEGEKFPLLNERRGGMSEASDGEVSKGGLKGEPASGIQYSTEICMFDMRFPAPYEDLY